MDPEMQQQILQSVARRKGGHIPRQFVSPIARGVPKPLGTFAADLVGGKDTKE